MEEDSVVDDAWVIGLFMMLISDIIFGSDCS